MSEITEGVSVVIAKAGVFTALGDTAMTKAAIEAGINVYQDTEHYNALLLPIVGAKVPADALPEMDLSLTMSMSGRHVRMLSLATVALGETLKEVPVIAPYPLFLAVSEPIPRYENHVDKQFIEQLAVQADASIDVSLSQIYPGGRAGGILALQEACSFIRAGGAAALVGGVDSLFDPLLLGILDSEQRILAEGVMDAFAPGEAAGFLFLISEDYTAHFPAAKAYISGVGVSEEKGHMYSDQPVMGDGLADAMRLALQHCASGEVGTVYASFNGESFHAKEYGVAILRNNAKLKEALAIENPGDCIGDVGAAFGPIMLALAEDKCQQSTSLVFCSSDAGMRGAVCLSRII